MGLFLRMRENALTWLREMLTWMWKHKWSNARKHIRGCVKLLNRIYENTQSNSWSILSDAWRPTIKTWKYLQEHKDYSFEYQENFIECMKSFIRVFESALLATWSTEYNKLLPWIHGNTHSDIGSNQLDTLRYAIECIKNTRSNT